LETGGRLRLCSHASPIQLSQVSTDHITAPHPAHRGGSGRLSYADRQIAHGQNCPYARCVV